MAEVILDHVEKQIGRQTIVPDLSLTIRDGEFFALVGPSGSGKSTVLHLIAGLDRPTAGRILFDGQDVTAAEPRERDVALVFQSYALYPHLTVAENLAFPLRVGPRRVRDAAELDRQVRRVAGLLDLERLLARRPRELSGGQRQRVALGRALIRQPRVFLLDEPLSNLDAQLRSGMRAELRRLHDRLGITTIYVTHDQIEAMTLGDRLAVLDQGRLQQLGSPASVYAAPRNAMVAQFLGHPPMNLIDATVEQGVAACGALRVPVGDRVQPRGPVRIGLRPEEIRIQSSKTGDAPRGPAATARLVEPGSGQLWVTVEMGATPEDPGPLLTGLAEDGFHPKPGERVASNLSGITPHLFDAATGERLE